MTFPVSLWVGAAFGHDPQRVRELARELLAESPFREQQPSAWDQLADRAGQIMGELLARFLAAVGRDTAVAWVIVGLGTVLLLLAVWRWTRGVRIAGDVEVEVADLRGRSSDDWRDESDRAATAGDLDTATRLRYLAVVAALVERGILQDVPGRTIRELDADLSAMRPDLTTSVAAAGTRVERITYGGDHADEDDLDVVDAALGDVTADRAVAR